MVRQLIGATAWIACALVAAADLTAQPPAFEPIPVREVAAAKRELAVAVGELDAWLRRSGAATAAGWKRYLGWDDLVAIVGKDEPPQPASLERLMRKLTANRNGLERRQFVRARVALQNYADLATTSADPKASEQVAAELDQINQRLAAYQTNAASGDDAIAIGRALDRLAGARQAAQVRESIRSQFGRPNLYASASGRLAAVGMEQHVDQLTGVRDNILGTDIHGTARMTGRTRLGLVENPRAATFNILLGGTAASRSVGYNGPVTIHATGQTSIAGSKQLQMTAEGLIGYRAAASCRTNSHIHDICAKCGLIERIAWKRAGQQKSQAEAIASNHAAARVAGQMDREAAGLIAEQNERYLEKFKKPLLRRNAFPEDLRFSTTSDRVLAHMLQDGVALAAPAAPPEHEAPHDIAVRVHESLATNFGEEVLGGYELTDVRLEKLIRDDLKAELPEELRITQPDGTLDPDKEPWSIIFAKELPVRAKFQDGGLWIGLRADGFTRGEGDEPGKYKPALTELVEISAAYNIEKTDVGATLRREGDVKVRFPNRPNPEQVTVRDNATVTFMRRKFRSLFKEEFVGEGIQLKDRWASAGTLRLAELKSAGAWLSLGWQMPDASVVGAE